MKIKNKKYLMNSKSRSISQLSLCKRNKVVLTLISFYLYNNDTRTTVIPLCCKQCPTLIAAWIKHGMIYNIWTCSNWITFSKEKMEKVTMWCHTQLSCDLVLHRTLEKRRPRRIFFYQWTFSSVKLFVDFVFAFWYV